MKSATYPASKSLASDMTVKAILDTDILSEYLKGHNATVASHAADYARDHAVFTFVCIT